MANKVRHIGTSEFKSEKPLCSGKFEPEIKAIVALNEFYKDDICKRCQTTYRDYLAKLIAADMRGSIQWQK